MLDGAVPLSPDLRPCTAPLRRLLDSGELAERPPIVWGGVAWEAERLARIVLADAAHYDDLPPAVRDSPELRARVRALAGELRELTLTLGASPRPG